MEKEDITQGTAWKGSRDTVGELLEATGIEVGLLINFGSTGVDVKRKYRTAKGKQ